MEYIYMQSDQLFRRNSYRGAFAAALFSIRRSNDPPAVDGYCAWGCFRIFLSGACGERRYCRDDVRLQ
jgi:hypothetical protein